MQVFSESGAAHILHPMRVVVDCVVLELGRDKRWFVLAPLVADHFSMCADLSLVIVLQFRRLLVIHQDQFRILQPGFRVAQALCKCR